MIANISLSGLKDAAGLAPEDRAEVERLVDSLSNHEGHNNKVESYYDGTFRVEDHGIEVDPKLLQNRQVCHWPEKAVDALADRVRFDGVVATDDITALVADVGLVNAYSAHLVDKYVNGCMFCVVGRSKVTGRPFVRFHSARTATAMPSHDYDHSEVASGLAIGRMEPTAWSPKTPVPTVVNVFLPNKVIEIRQVMSGRWSAETMPVPERSPMIVAFAHRPRGRQPFGKTRISSAVRGISDEMVRTMFRMEVLSAYYTMPQRYALGLTKKQYDSLVNTKAMRYADSMFLATRDADGNVPNYGQLPSNSPEPFIAQARFLAGQFSGATGVPLNSLGIVQDNPSSAEAISASREDICLIAQRDIESDRRSIVRVVRLLAALNENVAMDDLTDEQRNVEASFAEPMLASLPGRVDAVMKLSAVIDGFGNTTVGMRMAGMDDADISSVRAEMQQAQAMQAAQALFSTMPPEQTTAQQAEVTDEA